jgi:hypothetical protein
MSVNNVNQTRLISQARNVFKFGNQLLKPTRQPVEHLARALQPPAQRVEPTHFRREQRDTEQ